MLESTSLRQERDEQAYEAAEKTSADPAVLAAAFSVGLSWYFYFIRGDQHRGLFVGLWPPTILAFASYFSQTRMADLLDGAVHGGSATITESIQELMGSQ